MKLKSKMMLSMGLMFVVFVIAGLVGVSSMQTSQTKFEQFLDADVALLQAENNLYAQGLQMGQALRNIVLASENKTAYSNLEEAGKEFDETMKVALKLAASDPAALKILQDVKDLRAKQFAVQTKVVGLAEKNQSAAIALINGEETPLWRTMKSRLLDGIKVKSNAFNETKENTISFTNVRRAVVIGLLIAALVLGSCIAMWLTRSVTHSMANSIGIARTIASGNLNNRIEIKTKDEFGELEEALRDMNNALQNVVWHVRQGVETVNIATQEIASGNQDLSSRTEEQASSLEETASSMEELTSTVRQNADNARQANQLAMTASNVAVRSGEVVSQVVDTMHAIHDSSKKIADIISVIDGIAFQTNILALNAAVEAARAGELGRGFAVVATEVRNLAQRSANAAKEIKTLIDDSVGKIELGNRQVDQAGATMSEVVSSVKRVTDIMSEISAATEEQSDGIEQVNRAVAQMDNVTQQNAALVEQAAAAAESLKGQTTELANVISVFKVKSEKYGTTNEAAEMVHNAVAYLKEHGREKGFAEICNRLGRFNDRDLYVVVYDLKGRNLAHGAFPAMVGKDLIDAKDGAGKFYVRERLEIVNANDRGWQNYTFTNPVTKQMEPKAMYLEKLDDYIVGCGAYTKG